MFIYTDFFENFAWIRSLQSGPRKPTTWSTRDMPNMVSMFRWNGTPVEAASLIHDVYTPGDEPMLEQSLKRSCQDL